MFEKRKWEENLIYLVAKEMVEETQFKRKITKSGGRRVLGIPEEIDRALGKKENADIWLEDDKIVAEVY